jgi:hypothetical protein
MYAPTLLLACASIFASALSQSTSTTHGPTVRDGTITVSSYSAHPPSYTPPPVNTATESVRILYSTATNHSTTTAHNVTGSVSAVSNYTVVTSAISAGNTILGSVSSAAVATTSTGPILPISTTNAASLRRVAATGLVLIVAGSVFAVL